MRRAAPRCSAIDTRYGTARGRAATSRQTRAGTVHKKAAAMRRAAPRCSAHDFHAPTARGRRQTQAGSANATEVRLYQRKHRERRRRGAALAAHLDREIADHQRKKQRGVEGLHTALLSCTLTCRAIRRRLWQIHDSSAKPAQDWRHRSSCTFPRSRRGSGRRKIRGFLHRRRSTE